MAAPTSRTTKTAVLYGKKDIRVEERECPAPAKGEVTIRVEAVGICGSDLAYWRDGVAGGAWPIDFEESLKTGYLGVMGHESAGTVVEVGDNVDTIKVGDRVAIEAGVPCLDCEFCADDGPYNLCPNVKFSGSYVNRTPGSMTEYYNHPAPYCHVLPDGVTVEEGAMIEPLSVALSAMRRGNVTAGQRVLVTGAGPIGLLCMLAAKAIGASVTTITDVVKARLELSKELGATHASMACTERDPEKLPAAVVETAQRLKDEAGGAFHVTIECSGFESALHTCVAATRPTGKVVVVANQHGPRTSVPLQDLCRREVDLVGVYRYHHSYPKALELITKNGLDMKPLVTESFPLEAANEAFDAFLKGKVVKCVICPSNPPSKDTEAAERK